MDKSSRKRSSVAGENVVESYKVILVELEDAIVPSSFIKDKLTNHVKENVSKYLISHFDCEDVKEVINALREEVETEAHKNVLDSIPDDKSSKENIVQSVSESLKSILAKGLKVNSADKLFSLVAKDALDRKEITVEIQEDATEAFKQWSAQQTHTKFYVLSQRSVDLQKILLTESLANLSHKQQKDTGSGDISTEELKLSYLTFGDHPKSVKKTYATLIGEIEVAPSDVLFLTTYLDEATAASAAGINVQLLGVDNVIKSDDALESFCRVKCLTDVQLHGLVANSEVPQKLSRPE